MSVKGCTFVPTIYLGTYQHLNNNKMPCKVCIINFFFKNLIKSLLEIITFISYISKYYYFFLIIYY